MGIVVRLIKERRLFRLNNSRNERPLGGYLYWMDYMPENFPQSLKSIYPIAYNYSYLLAEAVITIIIISISAVSKGLARVKQTAVE